MQSDIYILGSGGSVTIPLDQGGWRRNRLLLTDAKGKTKTLRLPYKGSGYGYQAAEVVRCLKAGLLESEVMPLDESLGMMRTLDALRAQWGMRLPGEGA
jgi:hypothetical protein